MPPLQKGLCFCCSKLSLSARGGSVCFSNTSIAHFHLLSSFCAKILILFSSSSLLSFSFMISSYMWAQASSSILNDSTSSPKSGSSPTRGPRPVPVPGGAQWTCLHIPGCCHTPRKTVRCCCTLQSLSRCLRNSRVPRPQD